MILQSSGYSSRVFVRFKPCQISFFCKDGGKDCLSFSALSLSGMTSVYKKRLHRILNLVMVPFFLIFTHVASLRRAICKKDRISVICLGMVAKSGLTTEDGCTL